MNTKTDEGLYEKARKLFISKASIDEFAGWATPRQVDAVHRLLDTELANRERAKHDRLLRRARFPVVKGLDGYDFTNVRLPDGYMLDELLGLGFIPRAQDLVFYGKTGRGKTHLAIGLGMKAIDMGLGVRFHQTAELVLQLGKAKRDGTLETMLVFCQVGVGRFGVSFSPCERRVSGRFGVGRSCWLLVIALVIA